jgi:proline iminopeptidase
VEPFDENPIWDNLFSEHIPLTNYYLGRTNSLDRKFHRSLHTVGFREELSNVTLPVLVCAARHDFLCPMELEEDFLERVGSTDKKYLIFERSTHFFEEQEAYLEAFVAFVREHR